MALWGSCGAGRGDEEDAIWRSRWATQKSGLVEEMTRTLGGVGSFAREFKKM